jgi:hypothetical protein
MSDSNLASSDWVAGQAWRPQGNDQILSMDPATREAYEQSAEANVFGVGFRRDSAGRPIEVGIGSEHNQSLQHRAALQAEAERRVLLKAAIAAAPGSDPDPVDLQAQIDELKAQLATFKADSATASAPQP